MTVSNAAVLAGIGLAAIMLLSVCIVWIKHRIFGLGGSCLTIFSVVLMGLSFWPSIRVSISAQNGIQTEFGQLQKSIEEVKTSTKEVDQKIGTLNNKFETLEMTLASRVEEIKSAQLAVVNKLDSTEKALEARWNPQGDKPQTFQNPYFLDRNNKQWKLDDGQVWGYFNKQDTDLSPEEQPKTDAP